MRTDRLRQREERYWLWAERGKRLQEERPNLEFRRALLSSEERDQLDKELGKVVLDGGLEDNFRGATNLTARSASTKEFWGERNLFTSSDSGLG